MDSTSNKLAPHALSILRIVVALLFIEHGAQKLFGFPSAPAAGMPAMLSFPFWWQGVIEVAGGALLVLGLLTRPVAFILAGDMAYAYWVYHFPKSPYPVLNGGDAAILFCFVFLYLAAAGGGAWSVDKS